MYGMEVDPNEEIRRNQQVYGYPGGATPAPSVSPSGPYGVAEAAPAAAAPPPPAAPPPVQGPQPDPRVMGGPYGIGPVPELIEKPNVVPANPYGYPDPLPENRKPPKAPEMDPYYYFSGGSLSRMSERNAQREYKNKLVRHADELAVYRQEEDTYNRKYKEASHKEDMAFRDRQFKALEEDRRIDNERIQQRYEEMKAAGDAQRAETQRQHDLQDADRDANRKRMALEDQHRREDKEERERDRREKKDREDEVSTDALYKQANEELSTPDDPTTPENEYRAADPTAVRKRLTELQETANALPEEDVDPEVARQKEGMRIKLGGRWGTIRNGKFYPERARASAQKAEAAKKRAGGATARAE